jgi:DNA-binding MarR family transcriptional regulator
MAKGGSMAAEEIGERHLELLGVLSELANDDPDGVAHMDKAAQRIGLDTVAREADREEFERLVSALEEAGYVQVQGTDLAASYGILSVTEEGRRRLEEDG